jgi:hypothetical protein
MWTENFTQPRYIKLNAKNTMINNNMQVLHEVCLKKKNPISKYHDSYHYDFLNIVRTRIEDIAQVAATSPPGAQSLYLHATTYQVTEQHKQVLF